MPRPKKKTKAEPAQNPRTVKARWGERLGKVSAWRRTGAGLGGFVPVVRSFLRLYGRLQPRAMAPTEAMLVMHILDSKWDDAAPRVSAKVLATRMGISAQQVKRYIRKLKNDFLVGVNYNEAEGTYSFEFGPFFDQIADAAERVREESETLKKQKLTEMLQSMSL